MLNVNKNNRLNKCISLYHNTPNTIIIKYAIVALLMLLPIAIHAYVGPGAGITFLGALWAVIIAIVLAVGGFLVWPIRTLLRHRKINKQEKISNNSSKVDDK